jgi:cold shock CspA family protein
MTTGTITRMIPDRGFGFITDSTGQLYFFHMSAVDPKSKIKFDNIKVGMVVEFTSEDGEKGPRAKPRTLVVKETSDVNSNDSPDTPITGSTTNLSLQ